LGCLRFAQLNQITLRSDCDSLGECISLSSIPNSDASQTRWQKAESPNG